MRRIVLPSGLPLWRGSGETRLARDGDRQFRVQAGSDMADSDVTIFIQVEALAV